MKFTYFRPKRLAASLLALALVAGTAWAGVSRAIQEKYRRNYENKALFLKVPVFSDKQYIYITGRTFRSDPGAGRQPRFKVGDQLRVLGIDFSNDEIKFKLGEIAGQGSAEIVYKFDADLQEDFPNSDVFDRALDATFTEGLSYSDIDDARRTYIEREFDRSVQEMASTANTDRNTVLKFITPRLPGYRAAAQDVENLQKKTQDLTNRLAESETENRKLDSEIRSRQAEIARLNSQNAALQERIEASTSQLSKLGEDLRSAQGTSQSYQRELANLQRTLKIRIDANRDLSSQIAGLGTEIQKIQKENEDLGARNKSLQADLKQKEADKARLSGEIEELKSSSLRLKRTIDTLTSKGDSLARRYVQLQQAKDDLENVALSVSGLSTRIVEEKTEQGIQHGRTEIYLGGILLGTFEWRLPEHIDPNAETEGTAQFSSESIDYVKVTPEERHVLQSMGPPFKVRATLVSRSASMEVSGEKENADQQVSEREHAAWTWKIANRGTTDARLAFGFRFMNKKDAEIPVLQQERMVQSSNLVRRFRSQLRPIPLAVGAVGGFLLFGVIGIFRRRKSPKETPPPERTDPRYSGKKQL